MSELQIAIVEMLEDGYLYEDIAQKLEIPIDWVEDVADDMLHGRTNALEGIK